MSIRSFPSQGVGINAIAISPDGSKIFVASTILQDIALRMIDSSDGKVLKTQPLGTIPTDLEISPDGSYILVSCQVEIMMIDIQDWTIRYNYKDLYYYFNAISISRDGNIGITALSNGTLRILNLGNQEGFETENFEADPLRAVAESNEVYLLGGEWVGYRFKVILTYSLQFQIPPGA
jgi:WD40 repeat protein